MKLAVICCILFIMTFSHVMCQTKSEREERIEIDSLPQLVQEIISELPKDSKRVRFYKETDGTKLSYEIKLKYKKKAFSIEFNDQGVLEDIEIDLRDSQLDKALKSSLKTYFESRNFKYKLLKIQKQYVYESSMNNLDFVLKTLELQNLSTANYEIIAELKKDKKIILKELLFSSKGTVLSERLIEPDSYDHVMY